MTSEKLLQKAITERSFTKADGAIDHFLTSFSDDEN